MDYRVIEVPMWEACSECFYEARPVCWLQRFDARTGTWQYLYQ